MIARIHYAWYELSSECVTAADIWLRSYRKTNKLCGIEVTLAYPEAASAKKAIGIQPRPDRSDKEIKENAKSILWIPRKKGSRDPKEGVDQPLYEYSEMILGPLYNESWTRGGQFIL